MQIRCPHCHQPVELVENAPLEHIDCPSCGSHFNLLGEATVDQRSDAGRTIGHFELVEQLGMGQFGTVWMARDTELDRTVAVKIPRQEQLSRGDIEIFLREARAAAQLRHPNIVGVHEVGRDGDTVYIVSDLVHGVTLAERLSAGRLSPREAASLCATIADALHHAHQSGVIHRDLKPSNIMLDAEGQPHLMDFGLAKRESGEITMTMEGRILGTPAYMSPEQARGEAHHADARSDIYSLGVILFEVLTGELPFRGNKRMLLMQIIHDEPPSPRKLDASVPRDLETICLKCLDKSRERRYATAQEAAADLRRYLAHEPIHARPVARIERCWRWCRRNPLVAGMTAAIAASLIVGSVISSYFAVEASRRATAESAARQDALIQKRIAQQNADRAEKSSRRAAKSAAEAQANADVAKANAEKESTARSATERQLRISTAERLAALSHLKRAEAPDISLLLAVESGRATRHDDEGLLVSSHQALLDSLTTIGGQVLVDHRAAISCVAIAPNGRWIVTATADGAVYLSEVMAEPGAAPIVLRGHRLDVTSAVFTADSRVLVTGSLDGTARVWTLDQKNPGANPVLLKGDLVRSVAISPDGRWVATADQDKTARLFDLSQKDPALSPRLLTGHEAAIQCVDISPDGRWLVTGGGTTARVWDLAAENPAANPRVFAGHEQRVTCLAITADSRRLAVGSYNGIVRVWDLAAGDSTSGPQLLRGHLGEIHSIAFSPNGRWLITGAADKKARLWDMNAPDATIQARVLSGHDDQVRCVAFSADGRWFVTASDDRTARIWDWSAIVATPPSRVLRAHRDRLISVGICSEGGRVVTGSVDGTARVWDLSNENPAANPRLVRGRDKNVSHGAVISADARQVVKPAGYGMIEVWEVKQQEQFTTPRLFGPGPTSPDSVAISADGRWYAAAHHDGTVLVWDSFADDPSAPARILCGRQSAAGCIAISTDARCVVTGGHELLAWDLSVADRSPQPHVLLGDTLRLIRCVAISRDGRWVVAGGDENCARVWDLSADEPTACRHVLPGHAGGITCVAVSSDGRWVFTGSHDRTARAWDLLHGASVTKLRVLRGHRRVITSIDVSADVHWAVTGSDDQTVRAWDLTSDDPSRDARVLTGGGGEIRCVRLSPDGHRIVAVTYDNEFGKWGVAAWHWQWEDLVSLARDVERNLRRREWKLFLPGEPFRTTFPELRADDNLAELGAEIRYDSNGEPISLYLPRGGADDAALSRIEDMASLKGVRFYRQHVTDNTALCLAKLDALESLEMYYSGITDECIAPLAQLTKLSNLGLVGAPVGDAAAEHLATMLSLRRLDLRDTKVTDAGLRKLSRLTGLRVLLLSELLTDAGLIALEDMPELVDLDLAGPGITDAGLKYIARLTKLKKFGVGNSQVQGPGLEHFCNLVDLEWLALCDSPVSDAGLQNVSRFKKLNTLILHGTNISDDALLSVEGLNALRHLDLGKTAVTDDGLMHLSGLGKLEELRLHETSISDAGLKHLAQMPTLKKLKTLWLQKTTVTAEGIAALREALPNVTIRWP